MGISGLALDLSTTLDITALVLLFKDKDGGVTILPKFWIPEANARKRERRDRVPYTTWARQGYLTMTPGDVIDYDYVRTTVISGCRKQNRTKILTE